MNCPCHSQKNYSSCCEPFISGKKNPKTPEALMRSRYTAYTQANIDYIKATMRGEALIGFQERQAKHFAGRVTWIKLDVIEATLASPNLGYVEFVASFMEGARLKLLQEKSDFMREEGRWFYTSGKLKANKQQDQIISRNMHCPCGSLRKFKNCHGS